jgi:hypothetical protein
MTGFEIFYAFILPLAIAAGGWGAVILHERKSPKNRMHPSE